MAMKINSPYTAAITGGGFLLNETLALLPLLQSEDREELLKDERLNNRVLMINAETSRKKAILEISRRYDTMSPAFWQDFLVMTAAEQPIALFFVMLKTYKILFDFYTFSIVIFRFVNFRPNATHFQKLGILSKFHFV